MLHSTGRVLNFIYDLRAPPTRRATSACLMLPVSEATSDTKLASSVPTAWYADDVCPTIDTTLVGDVCSSSSSGSAKGSEAAVVGREMADSLELGLCEVRLAIYGGGAVSCESGRSDICGFPPARASLYGGAGDSSDLTLGWCDRSDVTDGCDLAVG
jgi:hypothetical protein